LITYYAVLTGCITLAIETSTAARAASLFCGGDELVLTNHFVAERDHSAILFPVLERAHHSGSRGSDQIGVGLGAGFLFRESRIGIAARIGLRMSDGTREWSASLQVARHSIRQHANTSRLVTRAANRSIFLHIVDGLAVEGPLLASESGIACASRPVPSKLPIYVSSALPQFSSGGGPVSISVSNRPDRGDATRASSVSTIFGADLPAATAHHATAKVAKRCASPSAPGTLALQKQSLQSMPPKAPDE
jgi:hypothetical protein